MQGAVSMHSQTSFAVFVTTLGLAIASPLWASTVVPPAYALSWGSQGSASGQFQRPAGLAVSTTGQIVYTGEIFNARIQEFDSSGSYFGVWGSQGTGLGQFGGQVRGIAI